MSRLLLAGQMWFFEQIFGSLINLENCIEFGRMAIMGLIKALRIDNRQNVKFKTILSNFYQNCLKLSIFNQTLTNFSKTYHGLYSKSE